MNTTLELAIASGAVAMFIIGKVPFTSVMNQVRPVWMQALSGLAAGALTGILCGRLITGLKFFSPVVDLSGELFKKYSLTVFDVIVISLTAAVCEELLFRAGLQRVWGIWLTSAVFILLHGYLTARNLKVFIYGIIMLFLSAAIGWSYKYLGLYSAICFHLVFDVVTLLAVKRAVSKNDPVKIQA
jgi:membrane protease YdiL (CAAX protease family)